MQIKNQYLGFLESNSLQLVEPLLETSVFAFEELAQNSITGDTAAIIINDNEVLGKRIEKFFEYCIDNSSKYHLITSNTQVFKDKITIGEIDFIVKDIPKNKVLHIELVYKFYLYDPSFSIEQDRWIGPNRKDSLPQKISKLKNHQFPLLYKTETAIIVKELKLKLQEIKQEVCFLANLFLPITFKNNPWYGHDSNCIKGYWLKENEFTAVNYKAYYFFIPQKKDWVVNPKNNTIWYTFDQILPLVKEKLVQKKSPLLWIKRKGDIYEHLFVVWW